MMNDEETSVHQLYWKPSKFIIHGHSGQKVRMDIGYGHTLMQQAFTDSTGYCIVVLLLSCNHSGACTPSTVGKQN